MKLNFWYVDVFSATRFKGNPAAVFFESDDLDEKTMQQIANELNLSDIAFLLKPQDEKANYKVRIFTPKTELPFAGHPTIAAAFAYKNFYNFAGDELSQECGAGLIKIKEKDEIFFVSQNDPKFQRLSCDKKSAATMLGLEESDISNLPIEKISTGIYWAIVMLNSSEVVSKIKPDYEKILEFSKQANVCGLQVFAIGGQTPSDVHIRTFGPILGFFEDPSCGSGNGCVASYIAKHNLLNKTNYISSQGRELGRESAIYASYEKTGDTVHNIKIGGKAVKVLEGSIEI